MKKLNIKNYKGFTLIEMLVVVLIIGILAGVALPQYTSAVRKARVAEAKITLRAISDAFIRNMLSGTSLSHDINEIDVAGVEESTNWSFIIDDYTYTGCWVIAEPKWENDYSIEYASANYDDGGWEGNGKFICDAYNDNGHKICKSLGGQLIDGYDDYYKI